jgi:hypothetical protein
MLVQPQPQTMGPPGGVVIPMSSIYIFISLVNWKLKHRLESLKTPKNGFIPPEISVIFK